MANGSETARARLGRHPSRAPLSQDFRDGFKRERAALALGEVVREVGLGNLSVTLITRRAQMARNTFYTLFESREAAAAFAVGLGNRRLRTAIEGAVNVAEPPPEQMRRVMDALLSAAEKEPCLVELCLCHAHALEGAGVPFEPDLVETLAGVLRAIRRQAPRPGPGPRTEELLALGILTVVGERLRRGGAAGLSGLGPELSGIVLRPFLGPAAVGATR